MPIYDITVDPNSSCSQDYRIEADNLEDAKDAAIELCISGDIQLLEFEAEGEESDDQESKADFSTKDTD